MVSAFQFSGISHINSNANLVGERSKRHASVELLQGSENFCHSQFVKRSLQIIHIACVQCGNQICLIGGVAIGQNHGECSDVVLVSGQIHINICIQGCFNIQRILHTVIGGLLNVHGDGSGIQHDFLQFAGQLLDVLHVFAVQLQADLERIFQCVVGENTGGNVIAVSHMLNGDHPGCHRQFIGRKDLIARCSRMDCLEIEHVGQHQIDESRQIGSNNGVQCLLDQIVNLVAACQQANQIIQLDIIQDLVFSRHGCAGVVVQQQIHCDIHSNSLCEGGVAVDACRNDLGIHLEGQIAIQGFLNGIQNVLNVAANLLIAVLQVSSHISAVITAEDNRVAGNAAGDSTGVQGIHGGVHDINGTVGNDVAVNVLTIQVQNGGGVEGQVACNIVQQHNSRLTLDAGELATQVIGVVKTVDHILAACLQHARVNDQCLKCSTCIIQNGIGLHSNRGTTFLILKDHPQIGIERRSVDTDEVDDTVNGLLTLSANGQIKDAIVLSTIYHNAVIGQNLLDQLVILLIAGQVIGLAQLRQCVGISGGVRVGIDDQIHIVPQELECDLIVNSSEIVLIHIAGSQQCGQVNLIDLLGQIQLHFHHAVVGLEAHVLLDLGQAVGDGSHLAGNAGQIQDKGLIIINMLSIVAQLHLCLHQLALAVVTQIDQGLAAEAVVVHDRIDQRLQLDLQRVLSVQVQQGLVVQADVGVAGVDQRHGKAHQAVLIASHIGLQPDEVALAVLDQPVTKFVLQILFGLIHLNTGDGVSAVSEQTI